MHRYVIKRLLFLIPTVLGVSLIIFFVMNITPGNPGRMILGVNATTEEVEAINQELGYYDPVPVRWFNYLKDVITKGDFGQSYSTKLNVFEDLWPRFMITLRLAILVLILSVCIGVPLGILSAVKQKYTAGHHTDDDCILPGRRAKLCRRHSAHVYICFEAELVPILWPGFDQALRAASCFSHNL